jgi:hypothetical protein
MVFLTMVGNTYSTKKEGNNTWGIWCKINFWSQTFSQVDKAM